MVATTAALVSVAALSGCTSAPGPVGKAVSAAVETAPTSPAADAIALSPETEAALAALEVEYDAQIGFAGIDVESGRTTGYRAEERYLFASAVKALAAAALLRETTSAERSERVTWTAEDVAAAGYSPVTELHIEDGLTYAELAEAAVRKSDNTALNLILDRVGGPNGLDNILAELGDPVTEVVDREPDLNRPVPGSDANTTTPAAFTSSLARFLTGAAFTEEDRQQLMDWMSGNATGDSLIRAGAPEGWVVADKSGGAGGVRNDVAHVTSPEGKAYVLGIFTARNDPDAKYDDTLVSRAAAAVLADAWAH